MGRAGTGWISRTLVSFYEVYFHRRINLMQGIVLQFQGIPTDEEQSTGLERRALEALKLGKV